MSSVTDTQPLHRLHLLSLKGVQMRSFHLSWLMFFICFFGWFGLAPLMPTIRTDLHLTKEQVGNVIIISVSSTIIARLIVGKLCDVWGPRITAVRLLLVGCLPVFLVGLSRDYTSFLLFRAAIGVIGASFVITQFHTSVMFAPNIKGTANAITGGWGNLGGGVTNIVMPLIFAAIVGMGYTPHLAWRYAMILPGLLMLGIAWLYYKYTADTPGGNYSEMGIGQPGQIGQPSRSAQPSQSGQPGQIGQPGRSAQPSQSGQPGGSAQPGQPGRSGRSGRPRTSHRTDWSVLADFRIWALVTAYAMSFGMELTFDNVASLHFVDTFKLSQATAGFWAGMFGSMNLFARALGGIFSDKAGRHYGMKGKGLFLAGALLLEGTGLIFFGRAGSLPLAIALMLFFALFLKMANGATFGIVPFMNEKNVGLISGIVGAGGNLGGVLFGFLFKYKSISYSQAFQYIGLTVIGVALLVTLTRFTVKARSKKILGREEEVVLADEEIAMV